MGQTKAIRPPIDPRLIEVCFGSQRLHCCNMTDGPCIARERRRAKIENAVQSILLLALVVAVLAVAFFWGASSS